MIHYLWIDPDRLENARSEESLDGLAVVFNLSPYATPKRVSGQYLPEAGVFLIRFDYIDNEPHGPEKQFSDVAVVEGQYTGKIISLAIPVDNPPRDMADIAQLQAKARDALKNRGKRFGNSVDKRLNQSVAEEVIEHDFPELAAG